MIDRQMDRQTFIQKDDKIYLKEEVANKINSTDNAKRISLIRNSKWNELMRTFLREQLNERTQLLNKFLNKKYEKYEK